VYASFILSCPRLEKVRAPGYALPVPLPFNPQPEARNMEMEMLKKLLTAQVLTLAKQLKTEKAAKGVTTTSDMVFEAISLINEKQDQILAGLR
jgi:hypothetical protein